MYNYNYMYMYVIVIIHIIIVPSMPWLNFSKLNAMGDG